jgi:hypothetical protein
VSSNEILFTLKTGSVVLLMAVTKRMCRVNFVSKKSFLPLTSLRCIRRVPYGCLVPLSVDFALSLNLTDDKPFVKATEPLLTFHYYYTAAVHKKNRTMLDSSFANFPKP